MVTISIFIIIGLLIIKKFECTRIRFLKDIMPSTDMLQNCPCFSKLYGQFSQEIRDTIYNESIVYSESGKCLSTDIDFFHAKNQTLVKDELTKLKTIVIDSMDEFFEVNARNVSRAIIGLADYFNQEISNEVFESQAGMIETLIDASKIYLNHLFKILSYSKLSEAEVCNLKVFKYPQDDEFRDIYDQIWYFRQTISSDFFENLLDAQITIQQTGVLQSSLVFDRPTNRLSVLLNEDSKTQERCIIASKDKSDDYREMCEFILNTQWNFTEFYRNTWNVTGNLTYYLSPAIEQKSTEFLELFLDELLIIESTENLRLSSELINSRLNDFRQEFISLHPGVSYTREFNDTGFRNTIQSLLSNYVEIRNYLCDGEIFDQYQLLLRELIGQIVYADIDLNKREIAIDTISNLASYTTMIPLSDHPIIDYLNEEEKNVFDLFNNSTTIEEDFWVKFNGTHFKSKSGKGAEIYYNSYEIAPKSLNNIGLLGIAINPNIKFVSTTLGTKFSLKIFFKKQDGTFDFFDVNKKASERMCECALNRYKCACLQPPKQQRTYLINRLSLACNVQSELKRPNPTQKYLDCQNEAVSTNFSAANLLDSVCSNIIISMPSPIENMNSELTILLDESQVKFVKDYFSYEDFQIQNFTRDEVSFDVSVNYSIRMQVEKELDLSFLTYNVFLIGTIALLFAI